jgi:hypothetical protein
MGVVGKKERCRRVPGSAGRAKKRATEAVGVVSDFLCAKERESVVFGALSSGKERVGVHYDVSSSQTPLPWRLLAT